MKKANEGNINDLEEGWAFIYKAIVHFRRRLEERDLNSPMAFPMPAEEYALVYGIVYNMCADGRGGQIIYDRSKDCMREYIDSLREHTDGHELMLRDLVKRWNIHKAMLHWMDSRFSYLYRFFTVNSSLPSLGEVGFMCFRDLVFGGVIMRVNVKNAVIALIDREREREQTNGTLLKDVVAIFVELDMDFYTNDFEVAMLEHTGSYYSRKAVTWISEADSYAAYLSTVEQCLIREKDRVARYLHGASEQKILEKVENGLLSCYMTHFLKDQHSGRLALLRSHGNEDILMMQQWLFDRKGWESIANIFKQYVIGEVTPFVKQAEDAMTMRDLEKLHDKCILLQEMASFVAKVIESRDKHMKYAADLSHRKTIFSSALGEAFEVFCNKVIGGTTSAEWLATLCDSVLKNDNSNRMLLGKVVEFVEYITDKDVFANFYIKKLTHRVLIDRIENVELEQSTLRKLMQKCGGQLTWTMGGMRNMFTDLTRSLESQSRFQEYLINNRNIHLGIELNVTVLRTDIWPTTGILPTYKSSEINVPAEMARCVEVFKDFYSEGAKQKKLTWIYSLGTCNIIGKFDAGPIEIIATTHQAAILLLFNDSERLSYSDIRTHLNLSDQETVRLLYSLACGKYKILLKKPDTATIGTADYFEINTNLTDRTGKVKFPMPLLNGKTNGTKDISQDRPLVIDASIVRIIKGQKAATYENLVSECAQQLGRAFNPQIEEIKKRIEVLIEREYLERDSRQVDILRYIP